MMKLSDILQQSCDDIDIAGLCNDSRKVSNGDLFFAYPGALTDGRNFINQAIARGAAAIVFEPENFHISQKIPGVPIHGLANKLGEIAARFYKNPSKLLEICGITGTNGKTTIAYQLAQAYSLLGEPAAYIGTLGYGLIGSFEILNNTTPDGLCLQRILSNFHKKNIKRVFMEVSSHALSLNRVDSIDFTNAIYTNLSHEHLDFHNSMDEYAKAKSLLFSRPELKTAVINKDDKYAQVISSGLPVSCKNLSYGFADDCDVQAISWRTSMSGTEVEVSSPWGRHLLQLKSLGKFNVYNSLAVFANLLSESNQNHIDLVDVMSKLKPSPGRMEVVSSSPSVIVDYAHTPDALENVLNTLIELKPTNLWVVFGCGGDRDHAKRSQMGKIASKYAHKIILTNDNPRTEDPEAIADEVAQGIADKNKLHIELDRRLAIHYALERANESDIVVIAGKGHEDYQIIGKNRIHFSDQQVVRDFL